MYYVYHLIDPRNSLPFYVGKGKNNRAKSHLLYKGCMNENKRKKKYILDLKSEQLEPIINYIVEHIEDEDDAYVIETKEIQKYGRKGYESDGILMNHGLDRRPPNMKGYKHTEQTKRKIREGRIGSNNPMWGRKHTDEWKKNHSDYMKKNHHFKNPKIKKKTLDAIQKRGPTKGMTGKKHSEVTKEKMRTARRKQIITEETRKKISETMKKIHSANNYVNPMKRPGIKEKHRQSLREAWKRRKENKQTNK